MGYRKNLPKDVRFRGILAEQENVRLSIFKQVHIDLCASIISQQLSTKVAAAIHKRFLALLNSTPGASAILEIPFDTLKSIGFSHAKHAMCRMYRNLQ